MKSRGREPDETFNAQRETKVQSVEDVSSYRSSRRMETKARIMDRRRENVSMEHSNSDVKPQLVVTANCSLLSCGTRVARAWSNGKEAGIPTWPVEGPRCQRYRDVTFRLSIGREAFSRHAASARPSSVFSFSTFSFVPRVRLHVLDGTGGLSSFIAARQSLDYREWQRGNYIWITERQLFSCTMIIYVHTIS